MEPSANSVLAVPASLAAEESEPVRQKVEAELTRRLDRSAGFGLFSNLTLSLVLVVGLWSYFPARTHLIWLAKVIAVSSVRLAVNLRFARRARLAA